MITCPICHGSGECVHYNGVDPQKQQELETCWLCHGNKEVEEVRREEKLHITKYYGVMAG